METEVYGWLMNDLFKACAFPVNEYLKKKGGGSAKRSEFIMAAASGSTQLAALF